MTAEIVIMNKELVKTKKQKNAQPASHKATPTPPTQYATDYIFKTLAAVVDTIMPGVQGESVDIVIFNETGHMIPLGTMNNLGSDKTDTPGATFLPQHDGRTLMPCYQYLYLILPQLAHEPTVINQLIAGLDNFAKQVPQNPYANFMDLPYDLRYYIFYIMNKEDIFASLLIQQGVPQNVAITQALQVKRLIAATISLTNFIYYSELCNLAPDPTTGIYTRDKKNSWESSIIAGGAWEQMGYAGPSYKKANFASVYEGLRVTIADGKVKFQS